MDKKIVSRSQFAKLAGVAPASITKAAGGMLAPALEGKRINANHPAALAYLERRERASMPSAAPGLDPYYEEAVEACAAANRWSATYIREVLSVGSVRSNRIMSQIKAAGLVPEKDDPKTKPAPPPVAEKPHVRGTAAAKEKRKQGMGGEALATTAPAEDDQLLEVPDDIQAFADMTLRELVDRFGTDSRFVDWLKATQAIEAINEKRLKNATTRGELVSRQTIKTGVIEPLDAAHTKLLTDGAKTIARRATAMHDSGRDVEEVEKFVADQITSFIRPAKTKAARALRNA